VPYGFLYDVNLFRSSRCILYAGADLLLDHPVGGYWATTINHKTYTLKSSSFPTVTALLVYVLEIEPSTLTDHAFVIVFPHTSVDLICP